MASAWVTHVKSFAQKHKIKYFLNIIYMDSVCEEIKDDMKYIESDAKKIDCYAILDLIKDCIKCFIDSLKCCFKLKYHNIIYL